LIFEYLAHRFAEQSKSPEVHVRKFVFDLFRQRLYGLRCGLSELKAKFISPVKHLTPKSQNLDLPGIHFGDNFRFWHF